MEKDAKSERPSADATQGAARKSSRRERDIERTRQDILDAAARAFARRGYHGTTMELVAQEAGYSVGSLYTYFKGKQELFRSLHESVSAEIDAALDRIMPASLTYRQRFELRLIRVFEVVEGKRELLVMYVAQRTSPDWDLGSDLGDVHARMHDAAVAQWASFLREGVDADAVRLRLDPSTVAPFVLATIGATIIHWARTNPTASLTEYAAAVTDLIFDGIGTGERRRLTALSADADRGTSATEE